MKLFQLILAAAASLAITLPAFAEDHEDEEREIHRRTKAEVHDFLKKHFPEPLEHLRHADEEGDEEGVEEFWHEASEFVGEFYLTREEMGGHAAEIFLILRRTEFVADRLTEKFHDTDDDSLAEKIKRELREVIGKHIEHRLEFEKIELERARRELKEAARELEEVAAHREEIVNEELRERLSDEEGEEDESDSEDEDDDEEEDDDDDDDEEDEDDDDNEE